MARRKLEDLMRRDAFVREVIDGDTFQTRLATIMRLESVNAPEINSVKGKKAKAKLEELILAKNIEYEAKARDDYGRLIVQVWVNGFNVNEAMIRFVERL